MKEFYKQLRFKIDELENKANGDLRASMFIRSQNFSKMLSLIQKNIDLINTENFKTLKNSANDSI